MDKLTTEQKAQRYNEALERAKGVIEQNPLMEYLKKGIEYIFPELKEDEQEWSEEDERRMDNLCHFLEEYGNQYYGHLTLQGTISWLKNLKDRIQPQPQPQWKPSDEQIIALKQAKTDACGKPYFNALCSLYIKLKGLKL